MAASSLKASKTYLGSATPTAPGKARPSRRRQGNGRQTARLVDNMLRHGMEYVDRGIEFYEQQQRERRLHALAKNAAQLGFQLVPAASYLGLTTRPVPRKVSRE